jgi:uncharacterized protein involved in response to NO
MFAAGMAQGLLIMALWFSDVLARYVGVSPGLTFSPPLPPAWFHVGWLAYGMFAFFIFGFILTAGPRWQRQPDTEPRVFRPALLLMAAGWLVADLGLLAPVILPVGLFVAALGWSVTTLFLWGLFRRSVGDRMHIGCMATVHTAGLLGLLAFAALATGGPLALGPIVVTLGLWFYLLPVFLIVLHRMLPFFSQGVIPAFRPPRSDWALYTMLGGCMLHGLLAWLELPEWTWLVDLPAAFAAARLTWLWRLRESFADRILAVLHVAFAWAGAGFALFGLHSLMLLGGLPGLTLAPIHAMTVGFASSTLIGMASRVTLGHSGKPIVGDTTMWACFWAMQAAALLRVTAEWWPVLNPVAALVWWLAFAAWAWRYAPAYWRTPGDGLSG